MRIKYESRVFSAALMVGLAAVARGQSPDVEPGNLASEVTALKTDNIVLREQLNKVEEQQKMLLEVVSDLRRRLDGEPTAVRVSSPPVAAPTQPVTATSFVAQPAIFTPVQTASIQAPALNAAISTPL